MPKAILKFFGVGAFFHFVFAYDVLRRNGLFQTSFVKLLAGYAGKHDTMAPGKSQLALVRATLLHQLMVALHGLNDLQGAMAGLKQGAGNGL